MATGFRPKLGMNLQNIVAGDQLPLPGSQMPGEMGFPTPGQGMGAKPKGGFFREGGMGRTIAGLIGDALLQQADMAPVYAPAMRQQQNMKAEEAQWSRRRMADREDKQWEWANKPKDDAIPPVLRDAMAWQQMTPQLQEAYRSMQAAKPQFVPDGLGGGQWVTPSMPQAQPQLPAVGSVIPDPRKAGGPVATPGNFPGRGY